MCLFHTCSFLTLLSAFVCVRGQPKSVLDYQHFSSLDNYEVDAKKADESRYPWIARVVHSRTTYVPHVCTAVCIDRAIFITASRCIFNLKVNYTRILYNSQFFNALAFVVPSEPTKQAYDDIGFVVVQAKNYKGKWPTIKLFGGPTRSDGAFKWFTQYLAKTKTNYKVVGYAMKKGLIGPEIVFDLTEIDVVVSLDLCPKILTMFKKVKAFNVPCYYSCNYDQFIKKHNVCKKYHGVEGGAVIDTKANKLFGVATWGTIAGAFELPVGFSVVNSNNFFNDLRCARRIRDDKGVRITKGYYQSLCDRK